MTTTLTACCSVTAYLDPICVVGMKPPKIRIGAAARCSKCHKIIGDRRMDKFPGKEVANLQGALNGTGWAMAIDKHIKAPGSPLNFEMRNGALVPENYAGELKQQPELSEPEDDCPF